ncbi:DUF3152 domain-containing protein [Micromonospora sp. DSM 115977]|uniref:DUF3152 domain-containing protein n=1 Tax=Micromonospora reichwaldensis TaxID=3075516 RepID=A0ABU2X1N2_9ACTN|nr:DUF3152 domain-containing protein [Micromonospora sp. DSM 115977]MDT0531187.1 DUF3152 domain-containing protein [Micromonospora sp. DSM 115977]
MDLTRPRHRRPERRRRLTGLVALVLAVGAAVAVIADRRGADVAAEALTAGELAPAPMLAPGAASPLPSAPAATPSAAEPPPAVLRLPGPVPSAGRGSFGYDDRVGPVLGDAGTLRRYRVAVESGAGEDAGEFAAAVERALAGPGSWVDGELRLQQVRAASRHDFTVHLATARTAGRLCAAGGVDIRVGGKPYTSCRAPGKVIINLDRWRLSVPHFVSAKVPLSVYRTYVVNHEVGHQLGHRHERCPGRGRVAPVMMQQTLFLNGCVANPWPYRDGRRYAGPRL